MQGNLQVRGRGRDAPVFTDGHEDPPHRGGTMPKMRVVAQREATLERLEAQLLGIVLPPRRDGTRVAIDAPAAAVGNA